MLLRISVFLALSLITANARAQFDSFKYIVVPTHFEDFRKVNQHQTSTLTKYFLTQRGFPAVYDTEQPADLRLEPCMGVYARLKDDSGMFFTRVVVSFQDCEGKIVFETREGTSKLKDYQEAYKEALQDAFQAFNGLSYSYSPPESSPTTEAVSRPSEAAPQEPEEPSVLSVTRVEAARATAAAKKAIPEDEQYRQPAARSEEKTGAATQDLWYAQETDNGFQLVDSTPRIRMKLVRTSQADTFIALVDDQPQGMVYKKGDVWIHEYYNEGALKQQPLRIKF